MAALSSAALLAASPSCCQMGPLDLPHPPKKGQPPIRRWEPLLLNQLIKWLAVLGVLSSLLLLHCCVHTWRSRLMKQMNRRCVHTHTSVFLQTVRANISITHDNRCLCSSNLHSAVEVIVYLISGCSPVKLWRWWFWTLSLSRRMVLTLSGFIKLIYLNIIAIWISKPLINQNMMTAACTFWQKCLSPLIIRSRLGQVVQDTISKVSPG